MEASQVCVLWLAKKQAQSKIETAGLSIKNDGRLRTLRDDRMTEVPLELLLDISLLANCKFVGRLFLAAGGVAGVLNFCRLGMEAVMAILRSP